MEPVTTVLAAGNAAKSLFGGIVDRWTKANNAELDADALVRMVLLEARRNLSVLDATIRGEDAVEPQEFWEVPDLLQVEAIEAVLGKGEGATQAFGKLKNLRISEPESALDGGDLLTSLYVRTAAIQALAHLNRKSKLKKVQIKRRLDNLRKDTLTLVQELARHAK